VVAAQWRRAEAGEPPLPPPAGNVIEMAGEMAAGFDAGAVE